MSKTITLRLKEREYQLIAKAAKDDYRKISSYITYVVMKKIEKELGIDNVQLSKLKKK